MYANQLINEAEVQKTWGPVIEESTGITEKSKLSWMSKYCHYHNLNESVYNTVHLNPNMNVQGMNATAFPSDPTTMNNFNNGMTPGSGDRPFSLLPLAMQVAAQTVGLDLVPVVPMAGPMGLLSYLDFVYEGGRLDGGVAPTYIKSKSEDGQVANAVDGYLFTKLDKASRIDGFAIYEVEETGAHADTLLAAFEAGTAVDNGIELVKALEDHIPGFSGATGATVKPMSREVGERTPDKLMGLSLFSKSVAAETFQVAAAVTREQVQDLKQFGVDAVAQVESVLTNELTQSINNLILAKLNSLGKANVTASGADLGLNLALGALGGETIASNHRRILTSILAAANFIANRGRRGAGNFCVVGPKVATALQSVAGFVANPMANTLSQAAGAIYPVGSVAGVNVYTDPRQEWENAAGYEVVVGRKGDGNGPGLVFMPYLMAESVQTIAEGTMAPKVAVKSRFALVEAGFHPETQYVTYLIEGLSL